MRIVALAVVACCGAGLSISGLAQDGGTDDLAQLRAQALELVNEARGAHGLPALDLADSLNAAAQAHARDMLERGYYAHVSPDGRTVQDRYIEHGGSRWALTAENIARCRGCPSPLRRDRVRGFHAGWMDSPDHRQNILREGIERFGFGIAADEDRIYAVQTFSGPGTPLSREPGEEPVRLSPDAQAEQALRAINRARENNGLAPLARSDALDGLAGRLLPDVESGRALGGAGSLAARLPGARAGAWRALRAVVAACGGCGAVPTAADVRHFAARWLDSTQNRQALLHPAARHLGFAMRAGGDGRKTAVAVVGAQ